MFKLFLKKIKELISFVLCSLIKFYQKYISPLHRPCCRFTPTCSAYALEAIKKYDAITTTVERTIAQIKFLSTLRLPLKMNSKCNF